MTKELHVNIINAEVKSIRLEDRIKELEAWQAEARPFLMVTMLEMEAERQALEMSINQAIKNGFKVCWEKHDSLSKNVDTITMLLEAENEE